MVYLADATIFIIIGAQGCGKDTHADRLAAHLGVKHLTTGGIFAEAAKTDPALAATLEKGDLVPADQTCSLIFDALKSCGGHVLLNGFPRNATQFMRFLRFCLANGFDYKAVYIDVPKPMLMERLRHRVIGADKKTYHLLFNPPPDGMQFTKRKDDTLKAIKRRLSIFYNETMAVIFAMMGDDRLVKIDGVGTIEEVYARIVEAVKQ